MDSLPHVPEGLQPEDQHKTYKTVDADSDIYLGDLRSTESVLFDLRQQRLALRSSSSTEGLDLPFCELLTAW